MTIAQIADRRSLAARFAAVRARSGALAAPLQAEDQVVQTMPDVSPTKWHLAHVTWFFETFVLQPFARAYAPFDPRFDYLFNSYYETVGQMHPRPRRGLLSRPTVAEVHAYRAHVDAAVTALLEELGDGGDDGEVLRRIELGLHHEQQHQELLLMDCKHVLGTNPLRPAYRAAAAPDATESRAAEWVAFDGGIVEIGAGDAAFAYDNERPRHRQLLEPFKLQDRLVTCGEWRRFMADGGYRRTELWMADGWSWVQKDGIEAPLYWQREPDAGWSVYTLGGPRPVCDAEPVVHVSWFEADAFARWAGLRLPREAELELALRRWPAAVVDDRWHPPPAAPADRSVQQLLGHVWQWTASPYAGYPRFQPLPGSLGEYNGKFMCGQFVLRGGACVTPAGHLRPTYRNFYYPWQRWPFSGLRLARSDV